MAIQLQKLSSWCRFPRVLGGVPIRFSWIEHADLLQLIVLAVLLGFN